MILPVVLISAVFFISASLGSEESCYLTEEQEDQCAAVCYPIVKPLLRYFEKCQGKEAQLQKDYFELQDKYSDLQESHSKVLHQLNDCNIKYERLHSKHLEADSLEALINQKNMEIKLLKDKISDLNEKSELQKLTHQLRREIENIRRIERSAGVAQTEVSNKNNQQYSKTHIEDKLAGNKSSFNETEKVEVKTREVSAHQQETPSQLKNKTSNSIALPDSCPRSQKEEWVLLEIQIPGSDPLKVICCSNKEIGSGWMLVYNKRYKSKKFNRTYEEYVTGFGDAGTDSSDGFFIGLEKLHLLTDGESHELSLWHGRLKCDYFVVGSRSEGYMVKDIGKCNRDLPLSPRKGTKFSTFDRDVDGHPSYNVAKENGLGWWFDSRIDPKRMNTYVLMMIRRKN